MSSREDTAPPVSKRTVPLETRHVPPHSGGSRTLGIDLASQPGNTAACVVEWSSSRARIVSISECLTDVDLLSLMGEQSVSRVAIDAPFGWPLEFVEAVSLYTSTGAWPLVDPRRLHLRETDRYVREVTGQQPLSVSADRIAYAAMRCARLLAQAATPGHPDRTGNGRFIEAYPAAALRVYRIDARRYKGPTIEAEVNRGALIAELFRMAPYLEASSVQRGQLVASDHAVDALICAILARTVEIGQALPIPPAQMGRARQEGWIRLPTTSGLAALAAQPHKVREPKSGAGST